MITPLDKSSSLPLYHQLRCALIDEIESGKRRPDEQLPNEGKLAELFGVSKITVRQALQELSELGYVRREQGRGTFISKPKLDQGPRDLTSFSEEMRRHKLKANTRVLDRQVAKAGDRVAEALRIKPKDQVFILKRLRMADAEPLGVQTAHIPISLAPHLPDEKFDNVSLYELLRKRYALQPAKARETYLALPAEADSARLLGIAPGSPVFTVERITFLANGKPFEYVQSVMRGDRYSVVLELFANRARGGAR